MASDVISCTAYNGKTIHFRNILTGKVMLLYGDLVGTKTHGNIITSYTHQ